MIRDRTGRFTPSHRQEITSRHEQPEVETRVKTLKMKNYPVSPVSSSFITGIGYWMSNKRIVVHMISGNKYAYDGVPFRIWEGFYYAHSKGTYYNRFIKGEYQSKRF